MDGDLPCYSNIIRLVEENVHMINRPTKRVQVTPSNISKSFSHKMAAETAGIDMERNYATVTLCINVTYLHRQPGSFIFKL